MARKRNANTAAENPDSTMNNSGHSEVGTTNGNLEDANMSAPKDRLTLAREKLTRMEETNKMCFRFRNDLARIEEELIRVGYSDSEVEYVMEPKGTKLIPGFGFADVERQRQYVNFLTSRRSMASDSGHAAAEEQRRENEGELEVG